jgi:hypothetical protein
VWNGGGGVGVLDSLEWLGDVVREMIPMYEFPVLCFYEMVTSIMQ